MKNFQIFKGLSWTGDRPKAIPLPTQHNRSSEKMQTHELVYFLAQNLIRSRNSVWQKKSAFFVTDIIHTYPMKAGGNSTLWSFSLRSFLQCSATSSSKHISQRIFEHPEPYFFSLIPWNWRTNCHICTVILCWDSRRKDENLPGWNVAGDPRI